ncbi:hypothetical protein LTR66_006746 [Elasticomyces elasticus]|nr:hypothetical protein LTR66_006746 [Elasticomyces elasticus]KAK4991338.1 hypothetical protein LTR50_001923 [Elasticomyces elasticus]
MAPRTINILLSTFQGLSLPPTLSIPLDASTPISSFATILSDRLPCHEINTDLVLTTATRRRLNPESTAPLSSLLQDHGDDFLPLRLSVLTLGGKGGFGSQLRAAGGRMSSRKNRDRNAANPPTASSRNLDGRRLRTITEAKNLAEYLALKPEMEKKEKEERRRRWEAVIEAAERKEEEILSGKGNGRVRLDGEWVETKEEAESKAREAVLRAVKDGLIGREAEARTGSESEESRDDEEDSEEAEASGSGSSGEEGTSAKAATAPTFFGWDDEDEDMSDEDDEAEDANGLESATVGYEGKGKAQA